MQEQPRMEVRAQAMAPTAVEEAVEAANARRPFVLQDGEEQCEVSTLWPSERDFAAEMAAFPDGPIFVRGNAAEGTSGTTDQYNLEMQQKMKSNICYMHDAGPNYSYILPSIICGSCPQEQSDIDHLCDVVRRYHLSVATFRVPLCGCPPFTHASLQFPQLPWALCLHLMALTCFVGGVCACVRAQAGVTRILNLQEEHDWQKFGIDFGGIQHHCGQRGDIAIVRSPLVDFSDDSLVKDLAAAVGQLSKLLDEGHRVYVHCTAGLGRAPAVIIAYMHWTTGMNLEDAYAFVTGRRRCHPRVRLPHIPASHHTL
jgi:hypothetical protein